MPRRYRASNKVMRRRRYRRSAQRGGSFWSTLKRFGSRANKFLKRTHLLSRAGRLAGQFGVPYVGTAAKLAGQLGYGRKRKVYRRRTRRSQRGGKYSYGRGLTPSGGSLRLAGRGCRDKRFIQY